MFDTQDRTTGSPPYGEEAAQPGAGEHEQASEQQGGKPGLDIQGMIGQLQGMITKVAAASEPTLREVAAKAAELAAVAAERAGPLAHTIADKTDEVSHSVAEKASAYAASMRARASGDEPAPGGPVVSDVPYVTDPAEDSPRDGA
jgi:hypothetical protein